MSAWNCHRRKWPDKERLRRANEGKASLSVSFNYISVARALLFEYAFAYRYIMLRRAWYTGFSTYGVR